MTKLTLALALGIVLASCNNMTLKDPDTKDTVTVPSINNTGTSITLRIMTMQGHDYIVVDAYKGGGICHSETCRCKKSSNKVTELLDTHG